MSSVTTSKNILVDWADGSKFWKTQDQKFEYIAVLWEMKLRPRATTVALFLDVSTVCHDPQTGV